MFRQGRSLIRPTPRSDFAVLWFASSSTLAVPSHQKTYCAREIGGFLASVLAPDSRAISIKVDASSGVSGLIWPGDYVDVVSTQVIDKADVAHDTLSETVLQNVRIVAIDQEIVQGGPANNAAAGKPAQTVSLQLAPEQVKKIIVAEQLGKLSLAVRSAVDQEDTGDTDTTVVVYAGNKVKKYSVRKDDAGNTGTVLSADVSPEIARRSATVVANAGGKVDEYQPSCRGGSDER